MVVVLICGGGNGAHVYAGIAASQPGVESRVFTLFADEAERWTNLMASNDFIIKVHLPDGSKKELRNKPTKVSKKPEEVVPGADIIVFVVPAFAHAGYLEALKPLVKPGTILVGMPGQAGFEFTVRGIWGDFTRQCTLMSFESLPWACRIQEFGKSAEVLGTKESLLGATLPGSVAPTAGKDATALLQSTLGELPKLVTTGHLLGITLMAVNGYIHPSFMYGRWHGWDGVPCASAPLFYHGLDEPTSNLLTAVSDEIVATARAIMKQRPQVDLNNVSHVFQWYLRCYDHEITDKTNLYTTIRTNTAYNGLTHPCEKNDLGTYVPNFKHRYLTEDIPFGLVVMRGIATIANVPTPNMDKIIMWAQGKLGQEYLVNGELTGKDLEKTRVPQSYGLTSLDTILGLA